MLKDEIKDTPCSCLNKNSGLRSGETTWQLRLRQENDSADTMGLVAEYFKVNCATLPQGSGGRVLHIHTLNFVQEWLVLSLSHFISEVRVTAACWTAGWLHHNRCGCGEERGCCTRRESNLTLWRLRCYCSELTTMKTRNYARKLRNIAST